MTAKLLMSQDEIDADPGRWLDMRREGITGSEIAAVLGLSPYASPFSLYHAKLSGAETEDADAMMRGRYLEPYVVDRFAAEHPWFDLRPGGLYASAARPWMMATFDRLAMDTEAAAALADGYLSAADTACPVQIKTSGGAEGYGPDGSNQVPVHYRAQALWEMEVWQADVVLLPVLFMIPWQVRVYVLDRDAAAERDIEIMIDAAEAFMNRLAVGAPPEVDWHPATTATLRRLHPSLEDREVDIGVALALRYRQARARAQREERRLQGVQNLLRAAMGNAAVAVAPGPDGRMTRVASRSIGDYPVKAHTRHNDKLTPGRWRRD